MKQIFKFTNESKITKNRCAADALVLMPFYVPGNLFYQPPFNKNDSFTSSVLRIFFLSINWTSRWYELRPCTMNCVKDRLDINSSLPYGADRKYEQTRPGNCMQRNSDVYLYNCINYFTRLIACGAAKC